MIILLTGAPGIGKSTIVGHIIEKYTEPIRWVVTKELRNESGERVGFEATTDSDESAIIAHKQSIDSDVLVGSYHDDIAAVNRLFDLPALAAIHDRLVVVDEIGLMQLCSLDFRRTLPKLFNRPKNRLLVATIHELEPRLAHYHTMKHIVNLHVTMSNREILKDHLDEIIARHAAIDSLQPAQFHRFSILRQQTLNEGKQLQLQKLLNNALKYIAEGRVKRRGFFSFIVSGNHGEHHVVRSEQTYLCDCDLAKGSGVYHGQAGVCSHMQAVMIAKRA